jgi:hypothetical protein
MPRRMVSALPGPVQLVQAAAQGFDLLLVGVLLSLGQFERFEHFIHVVEGSAECLDDLVDLFDRLLNARRRRGLPFSGWRRGSFSFYRGGFSNRLSQFPSRLRRFGCGFGGGGRQLGRRLGAPPPAASTPATGTPAASGWVRCSGLLRRFARWFGFFVGSHVSSKVP